MLQIFDIIGYVYKYIKLLRQVSPQEWIFKELQDVGNIEFRFAEELPQVDYAVQLAGNIFPELDSLSQIQINVTTLTVNKFKIFFPFLHWLKMKKYLTRDKKIFK